IQFGIVGDGVPDHTAAAFLPPFAAPGFGGHLHGLVLERLGGIARHRVEAPGELAGLRIERGDVTADAVLAAAHADHDASLDHARRLSDREVFLVAGLDTPHRLAGPRIDRDQPGIERRQIDPAVPGRNSAADDVAAALDTVFLRHFGVVRPD